MTNRPNRGWRIRGNTARAVIKRKSDPLEITMALESQPNGKQSLTLKAEPMPGSSADPPKMANYEFAPGKGRASGAGPAFTRFALVAAWQTPRQRGWTSGLTRVPDAGKADPAPAGMDRSGVRACQWTPCRPRASGDGPNISCSYKVNNWQTPHQREYTTAGRELNPHPVEPSRSEDRPPHRRSGCLIALPEPPFEGNSPDCIARPKNNRT